MPRVNTIPQEYARFHRLLSKLLQELAALPNGPIWLSEERHQITPTHQENIYAKALYRVASLEPYRDRLEELDAVQQEVALRSGLKEVPNTLFTPKVIEGVTHVRINDQLSYSSSKKSKAFVIEHIQGVIAKVQANYHRFEIHGGPEDAGSKRLEDEVTRYQRIVKRIAALPVEHYRVRKEIFRLRPYLYRQGQKPIEIETRRHGVILVGENIKLGERVVREGRSDKVKLEPLFHFGKTLIYPEHAWQEAKENRSK